MKKKGFGEGRWNGFGGKVKKRESIREAAKREMKEESGLTILDPQKRAVMLFDFEDETDNCEVHLYCAQKFKGELVETKEMKPKWHLKNKLPFNKMWPDDTYWMPYFLKGRPFKAKFYYQDTDTITKHVIKEVS